jgi:hypothetical protein
VKTSACRWTALISKPNGGNRRTTSEIQSLIIWREDCIPGDVTGEDFAERYRRLAALVPGDGRYSCSQARNPFGTTHDIVFLQDKLECRL